jgi:hypothetical protein
MQSTRQQQKNAWAKEDRKKNPARYRQYEVTYQTKMYEAGICVKCGKNPATTTSGDGGNGGKRIKFCWPCRVAYNNRKNQARLVLKQEVLAHYGPNGVLCCCWEGCTVVDPDMLSIDHVNNGGNIERRTTSYSGGMSYYAKLKRDGYPQGFQTLCHNHQWKKEILKRRAEYNQRSSTCLLASFTDLGSPESA